MITAATLVVASAASAQSLEEKTQRKEEDALLQRAVTEANEACGSKIKGTWDWASFGGKLKNGGSHVGLNCATAVEEITRLCRTDDTGEVKPAVQKGIEAFQCRGAPGEGSVDKKGKTIVYTTNVDGAKRIFMKPFLLKNL